MKIGMMIRTMTVQVRLSERDGGPMLQSIKQQDVSE